MESKEIRAWIKKRLDMEDETWQDTCPLTSYEDVFDLLADFQKKIKWESKENFVDFPGHIAYSGTTNKKGEISNNYPINK